MDRMSELWSMFLTWLTEHVVTLLVLGTMFGGLSVFFGLMGGYAGHREAVAGNEAAAKANEVAAKANERARLLESEAERARQATAEA
jgi:hypothetical protein